MKHLHKKKFLNLNLSSLKRIYIPTAFLIGSLFLFLSEVYKTPTQTVETKNSNPAILIENQIDVCFTPNKKCQSMILSALNSAKFSIYVQAYSITDPKILTSLKEAALRGIDVKLLVDQGVLKGQKSQLKQIGHPYEVRIDKVVGLSHNKVMIIDSVKIISGSYNYSKGAYLKNAENVLFIEDTAITEKYRQNFLLRWEKGRPFYPSPIS